MNLENIFSNELELADQKRNGIWVLYGPHAATGFLLKLCVRDALKGQVRILDFGNRCDMYFVARELKKTTNDPAAILNRIILSRAFTCYQALTLLKQVRSLCETPVFILDLMEPFLDESVKKQEAERLFYESLTLIQTLSKSNRVFIGVKPLPAAASDRMNLLNKLPNFTDHFFCLNDAQPKALLSETEQLKLF